MIKKISSTSINASNINNSFSRTRHGFQWSTISRSCCLATLCLCSHGKISRSRLLFAFKLLIPSLFISLISIYHWLTKTFRNQFFICLNLATGFISMQLALGARHSRFSSLHKNNKEREKKVGLHRTQKGKKKWISGVFLVVGYLAS